MVCIILVSSDEGSYSISFHFSEAKILYPLVLKEDKCVSAGINLVSVGNDG
jgi:hypothetical protein